MSEEPEDPGSQEVKDAAPWACRTFWRGPHFSGDSVALGAPEQGFSYEPRWRRNTANTEAEFFVSVRVCCCVVSLSQEPPLPRPPECGHWAFLAAGQHLPARPVSTSLAQLAATPELNGLWSVPFPAQLKFCAQLFNLAFNPPRVPSWAKLWSCLNLTGPLSQPLKPEKGEGSWLCCVHRALAGQKPRAPNSIAISQVGTPAPDPALSRSLLTSGVTAAFYASSL